MSNLVIGCGSIGCRHIGNLIAVEEPVVACDQSEKQLKETCERFGIKGNPNIEECFGLTAAGSAAFICTPANSHAYYARKCLSAGYDLFIEKPLSDAVEGLAEVARLAEQKQLITMVGCNMRFDCGLQRVKRYLDDGILGRLFGIRAEFGYDLRKWRQGTDYRDNYAVNREQGGGIILDGIHEFDYVCWLLNAIPEKSRSIAAISGDLETETEDICAVVCRFPDRVIGEIHVDCLQREYTRTCRVTGEKGAIEWDFAKSSVTLSLKDSGVEDIFCYADRFDVNTMYSNELTHFLRCCDKRRQSGNSIKEATEILEWVISVRDQFYEKDRTHLKETS